MHVSTTDESPAPSASAVADPGPLGLAGFALTTFLLSFVNTHHATSSSGSQWIGYAFAYGGLAQLLAGMWEFKNKNVFGATAFSTYGAFWLGLYFYVINVAPHTVTSPLQVNRDLGWILLAFAIFNTYMLIISTQLNAAVFAVFLTLELTEIFLFLGNFTIKAGQATNTLIQVGGWIGVITALAAWYASAAGVMNGLKGKEVFPVGKPLFNLGG
jgi:succinate-acetate transporter protein